MEKEILACIEEKNKKFLQSGQVSKYIFPMERMEAHNKKISHLITRFFIVSKTPKGDILYLVQKRGNTKNTFPEFFTDSSSGHVIWKKNLDLNKIKQNAIRELEEEFGIPPKYIQKVLFYDINTEGNEIAYIFFGIVNYNIPLKPNPEELDIKSSKFYSRTELENLLENEKYIDYSKKIWKTILNTDFFSLFEIETEQSYENRNSIALFIGRFQPLHHGHIYVLKNILKLYKKVKIGIGSSQFSHKLNDPFSSEERNKFINAALKKRDISSKQYEIYDIPDIFNAKKWVDHVISIVGNFNSIFSNSDWVRELFFNKGIKVEKKITIFKKKFNGNYIRKLMFKNDKKWKNLVPKEVIELIEDFEGIKRIKSLYKEINNP
ncbi:MAG: nicotinamide-nucleotide adenylyltransferase [Candidatus Lokiarchaeota archaeon]|nr:nicotinamide-nucleotide adenylyltransferase [Candidatus Lokiarchaeota archaeon]